MKMVRVLIQAPEPIKAQLDALRQEGTTASGLIRYLLEQHFNQAPVAERKGGVRHGTRRTKGSGLAE